MIRGHTDLALNGVKFSGNAQRRKKRALLFHGSILLDFNLALISELLPMPSREPDYRLSRGHQEFLTNLGMPASTVKAALAQAWNASAQLTKAPLESMSRLALEKYSTKDWNFKF
jgi:lipoate-protein ligase A